MDVIANNLVAGSHGWSVSRVTVGFDVKVSRDDGVAYFGTTVADPVTEDRRQDAKEALLACARTDGERERIEAVFAAPWVQA